MRIGLTGRFLALWAVMGLPCSRLVAQTSAESDYSPPTFYAISEGQTGPVQALFTTPVGAPIPGAQQSPFIDAYGNGAILPAGCAMGCDAACESGPGSDCYDACPYPYPGVEQVPPNYYGPDQCGPHYFDCRAEAVYMKRDKTFGRNVDFTSLNVAGPIVLSSNQLDYDYQPGFRVLGRYDLGPLSLVEFGYMGIFDWHEAASFTDPNPVSPTTGNLYSLFSDFGTNPATVAVPGGPMPQTERSITQSIGIESELQTAEMTYRRYWVGYSPRLSGTLLSGFRYTKMMEMFRFHTQGEGAFTNFVKADNDLAGFQTGADAWLCLRQGLRVGGEAKAGIYNNHFTIDNVVLANPAIEGAEDFHFRGDRVAFIAEASADVVADILPSWSVRAGAELLFLNTLVLAGENFNTGSPFQAQGGQFSGQRPRVPFLNDQGDALYFGLHAGLEYVW